MAKAEKKAVKAAGKISEKGLTRYNLVAGLLHLFSAISLTAILVQVKVQGYFPVTATYMDGPPGFKPGDTFTQGGMTYTFPEPVTVELFTINLGGAIIAFLLLSAIFHFAIISPFFKKRYFDGLANTHNYFRWTEYALSSSIMITAIMLLNGFTDYAGLIAVFAVNASMILFGALQEKYEKPGNGKALPFIMGCMTGIVPWIVIAISVIRPGYEGAAEIPGFVYGIVATIFIAFNTFGINQALQYRQVGKWKDYLFGERVYITLSFVAKSLLAWQVFSGAIIPALTSQ
ncbi:MAG: heliorhodopsin HeR [Rhodoluna sp.]|nr:heliorhodopsin HeR [Rhodoluna sp.]